MTAACGETSQLVLHATAPSGFWRKGDSGKYWKGVGRGGVVDLRKLIETGLEIAHDGRREDLVMEKIGSCGRI